MSYFDQDQFGAPSFPEGSRTLNPIPQPGNRLDGRVSHDQDGTALYAATPQTTVVTLEGSTVTDDETTMTVTPTLMQNGAPWPMEYQAASVSFTTLVGDQTLAAVAAGIDAAADVPQVIPGSLDLSAYNRILSMVSVDSSGDDLTLVATHAGATFTVEFSSTGSVVGTTQVTTGTPDQPLHLGTVAVQTAVNPDGSRELGNATPGGTILGIVMDSNFTAINEPGDVHKFYLRGNDARYTDSGSCSAYGEKGCAVDGQVYFRSTATGTEIDGALTDTATTDTVEIITVTPTVVNDTLYGAHLRVTNFFTGALVEEGDISYLSDAGALDTEIVAGLIADLALQVDLAALAVATGTTTLILTQAAGHVLEFTQTKTGVLAQVETQAAASDHDIYPGAKFLQTTTKAGPQAVNIVRA